MNEKILVIDDEEDYMQLMVVHLNKRGYNAVGFSDPKEALALFNKERDFVVIVTDWMMPGMSGNEIILRVQEIDPKTQAVIITAFGRNIKNPTRLPGWGNFPHLNKPLHKMTDLSEAVQYAIDFRAKLYPEQG